MLSSHTFVGPLKKEMRDFIDLKRSIGYLYQTEEGILKRFDVFLEAKYSSISSLSKEIVTDWCSKTMHETASNRSSRSSTVRQFSKYLDSIGYDVWILPNNYYQKGDKYVPHIYTPDELKGFFEESDKCCYSSESPYRHLIMPEFFRLLFSCGLRCSEARLLTVGDVDIENGILSIMESKKHNSRLVPMPKVMAKRMSIYAEKVHTFSNAKRPFFPALNDKPMTIQNIYKNFRKFLWRAGISHTGDGPRVHDFRHAYCIYRLKRWAESNRDLLVLIPMLRTYLGHQTFNETAYYLRLTADVFPDIRLKLEGCYSDIIPNSEVNNDEAD